MALPDSSWREDVLPRYRWRPVPSRAYEVWYGKTVYSHEGRNCGFWFRYELLTRSEGQQPRADVWGIHFDATDPSGNFQLHQSFDFERLQISPDVLTIAMDRDTYLVWDAVAGCVRSAARLTGPDRSLSWDLRFFPEPPSFRYVSPAMVARLVADSNAATPFEDVSYDGWLERDVASAGHRRPLRGAPGMLGHIWGARHADGWCWLHANQFRAEDGTPVRAALEALTLTRGGNRNALTTVFLRLGDEVLDASGPIDLLRRNRGTVSRGGYRLETSGGGLHVEAYASVEPGRERTFELIDTDGTTLSNTSSLVGDVELVVRRGDGTRPMRLTCRSAAALEKVERS